jgi:hypothetical protein
MAGERLQELDYAPRRKRRLFRPWFLIISVILPTIAMAAGLTVSHWLTQSGAADNAWFDWTLFGAALVCGAILFLRCGLPRALVILYLVVQLVWSVYFAIYFDCAVFGNCL